MATQQFTAKLHLRSGDAEVAGSSGTLIESLADEVSRLSPGIKIREDVSASPEGAKGVIEIGVIAATLTATRETLRILISGIDAWLARKQQCRVSIDVAGNKLEVSGVPDSDRKKLVEAFLAKVLRE